MYKPFRLTLDDMRSLHGRTRDTVNHAENPFGENQVGPNNGQPIDVGQIFNGLTMGIEQLPAKEKAEVVQMLIERYQPAGWSSNAAGIRSDTGDSVRDLVHTAMKADHMGDKIDAMNRANEQFWHEKQRA